MRSVARIACGLALVLVSAGCSGGLSGEDLPGQVTSTPAEASPTGAVPTGPGQAVSGTPVPAVTGPAGPDGGLQLSAGQLEAVLTAVSEAESLNAQVIPDSELRAPEGDPRRAEDIDVTPRECNVYAESGPEELSADASRAAMTFAGESSLQPDTVSLASLPSEAAAGAQVQASRDQLDVCFEYTIEISGQSIMTTVAEIDVDTAADSDFALRTTAQVPGTIQESITVKAVVGSTVADVLVAGSADSEADVARAERLTDLVVEELRLL